jgi:hypothetical protein
MESQESPSLCFLYHHNNCGYWTLFGLGGRTSHAGTVDLDLAFNYLGLFIDANGLTKGFSLGHLKGEWVSLKEKPVEAFGEREEERKILFLLKN